VKGILSTPIGLINKQLSTNSFLSYVKAITRFSQMLSLSSLTGSLQTTAYPLAKKEKELSQEEISTLLRANLD